MRLWLGAENPKGISRKEKMMPAEISAAIKSGRLKEITLTQAERNSRNEQMLQLIREGRLNIRAYWDAEERMVRFGLVQKENEKF